VRIALVPLDSRPPNWQFPQRLARIGGLALAAPVRELLGGLNGGAQRELLLAWLAGTAPDCEAAVLSWDALCYGGLIQSRRLDTETDCEAIFDALARLDWKRTAGYLYITVPRLGISVDAAAKLRRHGLVREYFIAHARVQARPGDAKLLSALQGLEDELGHDFTGQLWDWRARNQALARRAMSMAAELGLRHCHIAVEDNATQGPHIAELEELRAHALRIIGEQGGIERAPRYTFFDGADECAALLLARAALDHSGGGALPLRMLLHPGSPGPENYTGLYETHTLDDGLRFLMRFLRLEASEQAQAKWLIAYGLQPQPDIFETDPARVFGNPYLLPAGLPLEAGDSLYTSDLCACNGANPGLALRLGELAGAALRGLAGYNTNFNSLGTTAAWMSLALRGPRDKAALTAERLFLLERLADDVVYQSIARPRAVEWLRGRGLDPLNFAEADTHAVETLSRICEACWKEWSGGPGRGLIEALGLSGAEVRYSFPWRRAFECEVEAQ
jgi:hypothetical protein